MIDKLRNPSDEMIKAVADAMYSEMYNWQKWRVDERKRRILDAIANVLERETEQ